eukprot:85043-Hanusia_phi.AAC.1
MRWGRWGRKWEDNGQARGKRRKYGEGRGAAKENEKYVTCRCPHCSGVSFALGGGQKMQQEGAEEEVQGEGKAGEQ